MISPHGSDQLLPLYVEDDAERATLTAEAAQLPGVLVSSGSLTAQAIVVRDTQPRSDGSYGWGMTVMDGGRIDMSRAVLENNSQASIAATSESTLVMTDVVVRDTQGRSAGRGLNAQDGAQVAGAAELAEAPALLATL